MWFQKSVSCSAYMETSHGNVKVSRKRPGQAQGVPGSLRPQIFLTFGTTRVVGCQHYASAAFTPEEILGTHF